MDTNSNNKYSKKIISWQDEATISRLKESLDRDSLSIVDSDTVLGLLANLKQSSFQALNTTKGDRGDKPYLVLIGGLDKLSHFVDPSTINLPLQRMLLQCWPGPVTVIFKAKKGLPAHVVAQDGTIALRCPLFDPLLRLLGHFDGLFSTSANKSGCPVPSSLSAIDSALMEAVEWVVIDKQRASGQTGQPSTIIDCSGNKIRVVREGAYPVKELERYYESVFEK
ncbi:L-threonylcarbamoyladenylate synthase [Candidatus Babeliales bacterium]|nr:L-threonylcarbamoyladenylate synthase [Candidatus Babeliales bacterium]